MRMGQPLGWCISPWYRNDAIQRRQDWSSLGVDIAVNDGMEFRLVMYDMITNHHLTTVERGAYIGGYNEITGESFLLDLGPVGMQGRSAGGGAHTYANGTRLLLIGLPIGSFSGAPRVLRSYDITDVTNPVLLSVLTHPTLNAGETNFIGDQPIQNGRYLYTRSDTASTLAIIDTQNLAGTPVYVNVGVSSYGLCYVPSNNRLVTYGRFAAGNPIRVYNVINPLSPSLLASFDPGVGATNLLAYDMTIETGQFHTGPLGTEDGFVYIGTFNFNTVPQVFHIIDTNALTRTVSTLPEAGLKSLVRVSNNQALADIQTTNATNWALKEVDISVRTAPVLGQTIAHAGDPLRRLGIKVLPDGRLGANIESGPSSMDQGVVVVNLSCEPEETAFIDPGLTYPSPPARGLSTPVVKYDSRTYVGGSMLENLGTGGDVFDIPIELTGLAGGVNVIAAFKRVNWYSQSNQGPPTIPTWNDLGGTPCDNPITVIAALPATLQVPDSEFWAELEWLLEPYAFDDFYFETFAAPSYGQGFGGMYASNTNFEFYMQEPYLANLFQGSNDLLTVMSFDSSSHWSGFWVVNSNGVVTLRDQVFYDTYGDWQNGDQNGEWYYYESPNYPPCEYDTGPSSHTGRMFWSFGEHMYGGVGMPPTWSPGDPWTGLVEAWMYRQIPTHQDMLDLYAEAFS